MNSIELGSLFVGGSLLLFVALVHPWVLPLTAAVGVALILYGWLSGEAPPPVAGRRRGPAGSGDDLVECPNCGALESPERSTCRFCDGSLAGAGPG